MRTLGLAVGLLLVCGLSGRAAAEKADNAAKLLGTWEAAKADPGTLPVGSLVTFAKEGKMTVVAKEGATEMKADGTYKLDGDKLSITLTHEGNTHSMTLMVKKAEADALTISDERGKTIEFKRKK